MTFSNDSNAKQALEILEQNMNKLNLNYSTMAMDAPKDMASERSAASFDIRSLAHHWAGGSFNYNNLQAAFNIIKSDPELVVQTPRNFLELARDEIREFTMGQIFRIVQMKKAAKYDEDMMKAIIYATGAYSPSMSMRYYVHEYLFRTVIYMLGNKEQQDEWIPKVEACNILGCFAMTELGHSSSLRSIETTAVFDPATSEFVVNTPSITATKWWIGMASQTATHAVVIAQTIVNNTNAGLNWFVVTLRNVTTGETLPNVEIGDIGLKSGHQGVDNGWIQFRNARIPYTSMLAKWASIDAQGTFVPPPNPAVMYGSLIFERLSLVQSTIAIVTPALTVATRYGVVRRQGADNPQIMDYQSHYAKLIPAIVCMYMVKTAASVLDAQFKVFTAGGEIDTATYLHHMGEMHAISASLKGFTGWYSSDILETCRRACGGHAYSAYNAIGTAIGDWGVMTTGGGDNVVLLQQAARFLVQLLQQQLETNTYPKLQFKSSTHYIQNAKRYLKNRMWDINSVSDCAHRFDLLEDALYTILVKRLHYIFQNSQSGKSENDLLLASVRVGEMHCAVYLFSISAEKYGPGADSSDLAPSIATVMQRLTFLWGLHCLYVYGDLGVKEGFLTTSHVVDIENTYLKQCKSLRKEVIGLTDAWGLPDFVLKAPIARYDGDIYKAYMETLLLAPNSTGVPSYHGKYIKPLFAPSGNSKL